MCSMMVVVALVPRLPLLVALQAARRPIDAPVALGPAPGEPPSGRPLTVGERELAAFLAPLPIARLPLAPELVEQLLDLGLRRVGQLAALPREAVLERLGFPGLAAWRLA